MTQESNKPIEMLPCPNPWGCSGSQLPVCTHYNFDGNSTLRHVVCHSCGLRGPVRPTEAEAVTAWDTRTPAADREAVLEEAARVADALFEVARRAYEHEPQGPSAIALSARRNTAADIAVRIRALASTPSTAAADTRGLAGELERLTVHRRGYGVPHCILPWDLRNRILSALTTPAPAVSTERNSTPAEQERAVEIGRRLDAEEAPAVTRDETNLAAELERLLNKRADRSVLGARVHDALTHFVEKHRGAILSRLRGEG